MLSNRAKSLAERRQWSQSKEDHPLIIKRVKNYVINIERYTMNFKTRAGKCSVCSFSSRKCFAAFFLDDSCFIPRPHFPSVAAFFRFPDSSAAPFRVICGVDCVLVELLDVYSAVFRLVSKRPGDTAGTLSAPEESRPEGSVRSLKTAADGAYVSPK